jgi:putative hydrolase of the HAD superfamily
MKDAFAAIAEMARAIDPNIPDPVIEAAMHSIIDVFAGALTRVPRESVDVLTLLKARGKRIGLVSNASTMEVTAWNQSPLAPFFDSAIFSCYVGYLKPDRRIYEKCMGALGVTPEECVFIGDGGSEELEGARDLGMATIMIAGFIRDVFPGRIEERRRNADVMIERLAELITDDKGLEAGPPGL